MTPPNELGASVTLVKLGGSLITDKSRPLTPRMETLARLADEIRQADMAGSLLLGHGSGSFGHVAAAEHAIHHGVSSPEQVAGVVDTQVHAHRLHRLVMDTLWKAGNRVFSLAPSSCLVAAAGRPGPLDDQPLVGVLRLGLVPVIFGDVVIDREWGASICSTEQAFEVAVEALTTAAVEVSRILWLGVTDGVDDATGETIPCVEAENQEAVLAAAGASRDTDVTGGMRLRLETACRLANRGVPSWIGNGLEPGRLRDALMGRDVPGTTVLPTPDRIS